LLARLSAFLFSLLLLPLSVMELLRFVGLYLELSWVAILTEELPAWVNVFETDSPIYSKSF